MFGSLGMFEMVIIAGVALVVVGPDKFPPFAKAVFKTFRDLKTQIEETQREISKEIKPIQKEMRELSKHKPEDYIDSLVSGKSTSDDTPGDTSGDPDFDYEYPYREHETTTKESKEKTETTEGATPEPEPAEPPEGTETFDATAADSPPQDKVEEDINLEPDGPDWDRYDAEQRAASGDGTD